MTSQVLRVSLNGAMPSGEVWSVNPVYSIGGDFGVPVSATQAQTIATAIANITPGAALLGAMAPSTTFVGCRVEARSAAGVLESLAEGVRATPLNGTGSTIHPYQTAMVFSLRTASAGGSGRGRLYWPATGIGLGSADYRLIPATATSLLAGMKSYLTSINAAIAATLTGVSLGVWSRLGNSIQPVTSLQLGNVLDTQRRRRDTLIEAIQSTTYPT